MKVIIILAGNYASLIAQLVKKKIYLQCWRPGFDPWFGEIPGEGKGYPLQYSGLENSMNSIVHGVAVLDTTEQLSLSDVIKSSLQL